MPTRPDRRYQSVTGSGRPEAGPSLTLKQLGELTNLSHSYLSEVETGRTALSISNLYNVAKALDMPPQAFLGLG